MCFAPARRLILIVNYFEVKDDTKEEPKVAFDESPSSQTRSNFTATIRALVQRLNPETGVTLAETKSTDNPDSALEDATNELTINKPKSGKIEIIL